MFIVNNAKTPSHGKSREMRYGLPLSRAGKSPKENESTDDCDIPANKAA